MVDRRLGRGLDFFLSRNTGTERDPEAQTAEPNSANQVVELELSSLEANPFQPRKEFGDGELQELASSIRQSGVLQPILVRKAGSGYQIVAGERRWRAAKAAGLERIPALVRELDDQQLAVLGLVENLQRSDLNALEKAQAFVRIQELTGFGQDEVARQVGLERSTVTNFVRLLSLPDEVQTHVAQGNLSMGQARALLGIDDKEQQLALAEDCIRRGLTVRQVEEIVRASKAKAPTDPELDGTGKPKSRKPAKDVWVQEIEDSLVRVFDASAVKVRYGRKRSSITIEVSGKDDFERLLSQLRESTD